MSTQSKPNLRALLNDHKAKARKSSTVRIPWTLDGDLADRYDELMARRGVVEAKTRIVVDEDDERASGPAVNAAAIAELAALDEQIAEVKAAGEAATVMLVFRSLTSTRYAEVYNASVASSDDAAEQWDRFTSDLTAACFVGAEQDGELDEAITWAEIVAAVDEAGAPLMPFGHVDAIQSMVYAANRQGADTPFLSKPSERTR